MIRFAWVAPLLLARPGVTRAQTAEPWTIDIAGSRTPATSILVASDSLRGELRRILAAGTPERPVRVAHLGDSHSEQGGFAAEFATRLSGGAPVAPAFVTPYSRGLGLVRIQLSKGWLRSTWRQGPIDKIEGPSGSSAVTGLPSATMRLELPRDLPAGTRLTVWWSGPAGASFHLRAEGIDRIVRRSTTPQKDAPLDTAVLLLRAGTRDVILDGIRVPSRTQLRIGGFTIERPDATIEYDLLGLGATTQRHPLVREAGSLRQFLGTRRPDLILLWYGTNSVREAPFASDRFRRDLVNLIQLVRQASPDAALLVVGPPDLAELVRAARPAKRSRRTRRRTRPTPPPPIACPADPAAPSSGARTGPTGAARRSHPNVGHVRDLMRDAALAHGAAFLDPYALQGETGGMVRWYCATPRLSSGDLIHLTDAGYRQLASSLAEALARRPAP